MKRIEVLQEVLLALVGFTGDIVVSDFDIDVFEDPIDVETLFLPGAFSVRQGFHGLSHAERDQINSIVSLGRFHLVFQGYCRFYSVGWEKNTSKQSYYRLAMCEALQEMNEEYLQDIANLEILVLNEEALTVSSLCQHVQKVRLLYFMKSLIHLPTNPETFTFPSLVHHYLSPALPCNSSVRSPAYTRLQASGLHPHAAHPPAAAHPIAEQDVAADARGDAQADLPIHDTR